MPDVSADAAIALGKMGIDSRSAEKELIRILNSDDKPTRLQREAVRALSAIGWVGRESNAAVFDKFNDTNARESNAAVEKAITAIGRAMQLIIDCCASKVKHSFRTCLAIDDDFAQLQVALKGRLSHQ